VVSLGQDQHGEPRGDYECLSGHNDTQEFRETTSLDCPSPLGNPRTPSEMTLQTAWRRVQITMRWSRQTIEVLKGRGPGWSNFAEEAVKRALKRGVR
jgi:hypothetical protein